MSICLFVNFIVILFLLCVFVAYAIPDYAQVLPLALRSGIVPGSAPGTICDAEDQIMVGFMQVKHPIPYTVSQSLISEVLTNCEVAEKSINFIVTSMHSI